MTLLMVRLIGLLGAVLFVGVLLAGVCVVVAAVADLVWRPRDGKRAPARAADVRTTISGPRAEPG